MFKSVSFAMLTILAGTQFCRAQEYTSGPAIVSGGLETRYGSQWFNGRLVSPLGDLPVAVGFGGTVNDNAVRLDAGVAAQLGEQSIVSFVFRGSNERADQALGVVTEERVSAFAFSGRVEHTLPASPNLTIFGIADAWHSPGGVVLQTNLLSSTSFGGADGFRVAPGFEINLEGDLMIMGTVGWEDGYLNGTSGLFAEIEVIKPLNAFVLSAKGWTSPNFGTGAKVSIGYEFETGLQASLFGGFESAAIDQAFAGVRLSMPLGAQPGERSGAVVEELTAHLGHVADTMPGLPFTARRGVTSKSLVPPGPAPLFRDVDGNVCATQQATPGCTFRISNGSRLTVADDPDFNSFGGGNNDLGYVTFDNVGNVAVYNHLGQFQYATTVSTLPGYVGGTSIGVGTNPANWEDIRNGTYWFGRNQVLYSANGGAPNYGQAIN